MEVFQSQVIQKPGLGTLWESKVTTNTTHYYTGTGTEEIVFKLEAPRSGYGVFIAQATEA